MRECRLGGCGQQQIRHSLNAREMTIWGTCGATAPGGRVMLYFVEGGQRWQVVQQQALAPERDRFLQGALSPEAGGKLGGLLNRPIVRADRAGLFDPETTVDILHHSIGHSRLNVPCSDNLADNWLRGYSAHQIILSISLSQQPGSFFSM